MRHAAALWRANDCCVAVSVLQRHGAINVRLTPTRVSTSPPSFRQSFRFGLEASRAFSEVHEVVAEELGRHSAASWSHASNATKPACETLLPRMPLPPASTRSREG
jgi:hypothetical protein